MGMGINPTFITGLGLASTVGAGGVMVGESMVGNETDNMRPNHWVGQTKMDNNPVKTAFDLRR